MTEPTPNRLAQATSPYLRQHAGNPVDWYPWGEEALAAARRLDRPIFLSIGYAACHWCHVMERESFEDPETARLLNERFVSVKVDREERPDLDEVYMQAVQLLTGGHGGWPMSVFLTPALEPYFGGTYFPPEDRHGLPGFRTVLRFASDLYGSRRADVEATTKQVTEALRQLAAGPPAGELPGQETLDAAYHAFRRTFDAEAGGFGGAPKFPPAMAVAFLLRRAERQGDGDALHMAEHTLRRMARGGIYDQLGGGFHRYATDAHWLVPHFEKMLYDNALLARVYVEAYQCTGRAAYRTTCEDILEYVAREMRSPEGAFCSSQDADSEGVEGRYFVWTPEELRAVLGGEDARVACRYYGVGPRGNFEGGTSVLSVPRDLDVVALDLGLEMEALQGTVARIRKALLEARSLRQPPARDDKVVVAWNGLMISAFAAAYQALRAPAYLQLARTAAEAILERAGAGLFRTCRDGAVQGRGFLDDHAAFVGALLDLYEATFEARWMEAALQLDDTMQRDFWDEGAGGYFYTGDPHEGLLARSRQPYDHATPSGNALACANLVRLAALGGDATRRQRAERVLALFAEPLQRAPTGMASMLVALDLALGPLIQIAIAGHGPDAERLASAAFAGFAPRKVVAGWPSRGAAAPLALLEGRSPVRGRAAAYVCRDFTCDRPILEPDVLRRQIGAPAAPPDA